MDTGATGGFSIGVLADRTGLTPAVLRTWENRFGFPSGERSPTGHRRFSEADVELVRQVLEVRESGVGLQVAIDAVRRRQEQGAVESVHAVLSRDFPHLVVHRLGRRALLAASHAVEDERSPAPTARWSSAPSRKATSSPAPGTAGTSWRVRRRGRPSWPSSTRHIRPTRRRSRPGASCRSARPCAGSGRWSPSAPHTPPSSRRGRCRPHRGARRSTSRSSARTAAALAAARVLVDVARASGATPPASATAVLDEPAHGPATAAVDADRMWLRALARLDPPG